jgi:hypothetical protein
MDVNKQTGKWLCLSKLLSKADSGTNRRIIRTDAPAFQRRSVFPEPEPLPVRCLWIHP